ncbi:MAG: phosphoribosyltransferase family protein [Patescibacteria group bacterium]|nr:phosphoribosyltransferase family protein [Patescibacteria group bacterium]
MCGIAGYAVRRGNAAAQVLRMQVELEGRGQHSAGVHALGPDGTIRYQNRLGPPSHLIQRVNCAGYPGCMAIGHNRYATAGTLADAQPLWGRINDRQISLAVNGDTVRIDGMTVAEYRRSLRTVFRADSDTEVLLHLVAQMPGLDLVEMLQNAFRRVEGAWSLLALLNDGRMVAMRDPWGFRPLWMGRGKGCVAFASEDCALPREASRRCEVAPGEMIIVGPGLVVERRTYAPPAERLFRCSFEEVYFKSPGSRGVYRFRTACGKATAEEMMRADAVPACLDGVVPVLDSGRDGGNAVAYRLGLPVICGVNRTRLSKGFRAFQGHTEAARRKIAFGKHAPNREAIRGKRILLVEDSIVRGDTLIVLIAMLRAAGAREVHVAVVSPRITGPCYYGIATPKREKLIAANLDMEETRNKLGADSLFHLSVAGFQANYHLLSIAGFREHLTAGRDVCDACLTGDYPPFVLPGA